MVKTEFYNVGQIREAIKDLPDDHVIMAQVVDQQGAAWNMHMTLYTNVKGRFPTSIVMSHPDLKILPEFN